MPIGVDWPEEIYTEPESRWTVFFDGTPFALAGLDIALEAPTVDGPLRFKISSEDIEVVFDLELIGATDAPNYRFVQQGNRRVEVARGETLHNAAEFFYYNPPVFWFADGSSLRATGTPH